ncbi:hypothetical protein CS369_09300, partial [Candidatus Symbiopectobacterium sp. 'North America']|uniref:hypothetical protein n=1 Tax=Candidatus Symbiopectobacterium sp. 'North America' TaxID=2794574 RepID=UPI0018CBB7A8
GTGYYWRKFADGRAEIFARVSLLIGERKDVVFPVKLANIIYFSHSLSGDYLGANAYVCRAGAITNAGFSITWDVWQANTGVNNKMSVNYHAILV